MVRPPYAVDVTAALVGNTGVARYARQVPAAMTALGADVLQFAVCRPQPGVDTAGIRTVPFPRRFATIVWRTGKPHMETVLRRRVSLVHSLDLTPPPSGRPRIATVHDLGGLTRPDLHSEATRVGAQAQLDAALGADAVFAISAATRDELVSFGVGGSRIHVTPSALPDLPVATGRARRDPGYAVAVGMVTPRKGFDVLVAALAELPDLRLVLVGPDGFRADELHAAIAASPARDRIELPGFVSDEELAVLLRDAACQVVPSRVEGFGLPPLEAMQRGTPVVCSDLPAVREVSGDEVPFYAPPDDPSALAGAISAALAEPRDSARLQAGRDVAAAWTWERAARAVLAGYDAVLA